MMKPAENSNEHDNEDEDDGFESDSVLRQVLSQVRKAYVKLPGDFCGGNLEATEFMKRFTTPDVSCVTRPSSIYDSVRLPPAAFNDVMTSRDVIVTSATSDTTMVTSQESHEDGDTRRAKLFPSYPSSVQQLPQQKQLMDGRAGTLNGSGNSSSCSVASSTSRHRQLYAAFFNSDVTSSDDDDENMSAAAVGCQTNQFSDRSHSWTSTQKVSQSQTRKPPGGRLKERSVSLPPFLRPIEEESIITDCNGLQHPLSSPDAEPRAEVELEPETVDDNGEGENGRRFLSESDQISRCGPKDNVVGVFLGTFKGWDKASRNGRSDFDSNKSSKPSSGIGEMGLVFPQKQPLKINKDIRQGALPTGCECSTSSFPSSITSAEYNQMSCNNSSATILAAQSPAAMTSFLDNFPSDGNVSCSSKNRSLANDINKNVSHLDRSGDVNSTQPRQCHERNENDDGGRHFDFQTLECSYQNPQKSLSCNSSYKNNQNNVPSEVASTPLGKTMISGTQTIKRNKGQRLISELEDMAKNPEQGLTLPRPTASSVVHGGTKLDGDVDSVARRGAPGAVQRDDVTEHWLNPHRMFCLILASGFTFVACLINAPPSLVIVAVAAASVASFPFRRSATNGASVTMSSKVPGNKGASG